MAKFRIADEFTTRDGNWQPNGEPFGIDREHAERYAEAAPQLGGATHIFVLAPMGTKVAFRNRYSNEIVQEDLSDGGWIDFPMQHSSSYVPDRGEIGPWDVLVEGETVAEGVGLPNSWHISKFLVIEKTGEDGGSDDGPTPVPMPEPEPDKPSQIWVTVNTGEVTYAGYIPKQGDV